MNGGVNMSVVFNNKIRVTDGFETISNDELAFNNTENKLYIGKKMANIYKYKKYQVYTQLTGSSILELNYLPEIYDMIYVERSDNSVDNLQLNLPTDLIIKDGIIELKIIVKNKSNTNLTVVPNSNDDIFWQNTPDVRENTIILFDLLYLRQ